MEKFFRGAIAALSFLLIVMFCVSSHSTAPVQSSQPVEPIIKDVEFEQVPAVVNLEARNAKQYDWKTSR